MLGKEGEDALLSTKPLIFPSMSRIDNFYCHNIQEQSQTKLYSMVTTKDSLKTVSKYANLETTR